MKVNENNEAFIRALRHVEEMRFMSSASEQSGPRGTRHISRFVNGGNTYSSEFCFSNPVMKHSVPTRSPSPPLIFAPAPPEGGVRWGWQTIPHNDAPPRKGCAQEDSEYETIGSVSNQKNNIYEVPRSRVLPASMGYSSLTLHDDGGIGRAGKVQGVSDIRNMEPSDAPQLPFCSRKSPPNVPVLSFVLRAIKHGASRLGSWISGVAGGMAFRVRAKCAGFFSGVATVGLVVAAFGGLARYLCSYGWKEAKDVLENNARSIRDFVVAAWNRRRSAGNFFSRRRSASDVIVGLSYRKID